MVITWCDIFSFCLHLWYSVLMQLWLQWTTKSITLPFVVSNIMLTFQAPNLHFAMKFILIDKCKWLKFVRCSFTEELDVYYMYMYIYWITCYSQNVKITRSGIHIYSRLVVRDVLKLIGTTKTTRKLVCWTSLVLLYQKKKTVLSFSDEFPAFWPLVIHSELFKLTEW